MMFPLRESDWKIPTLHWRSLLMQAQDFISDFFYFSIPFMSEHILLRLTKLNELHSTVQKTSVLVKSLIKIQNTFLHLYRNNITVAIRFLILLCSSIVLMLLSWASLYKLLLIMDIFKPNCSSVSLALDYANCLIHTFEKQSIWIMSNKREELTDISFPMPVWARLGFIPLPICHMITSAGWLL